MDKRLVKIGETARLPGTTPAQLRQWDASGELVPVRRHKDGPRPCAVADLSGATANDAAPTLCHARVSIRDRKSDLDRQQEALEAYRDHPRSRIRHAPSHGRAAAVVGSGPQAVHPPVGADPQGLPVALQGRTQSTKRKGQRTRTMGTTGHRLPQCHGLTAWSRRRTTVYCGPAPSHLGATSVGPPALGLGPAGECPRPRG